MDSWLDQNEAKLGVLVLAVSLQVLADGDSTLDHVVQVFWKIWGQTLGLQDSEDLVASNETDLGNTMGIPEDNTDLWWRKTLLGELKDLLLHVIWGELQPLKLRDVDYSIRLYFRVICVIFFFISFICFWTDRSILILHVWGQHNHWKPTEQKVLILELVCQAFKRIIHASWRACDPPFFLNFTDRKFNKKKLRYLVLWFVNILMVWCVCMVMPIWKYLY